MADKEKDKSNLHFQEEFGRAKRNALWFSSLVVILWMVHSPEGDIQAPMLGVEAKVSALWLRKLVWVAALYCAVGFWRQARNVDRINSELLYTQQFTNLDERLELLSQQFNQLAEESKRLNALAAPVKFVPPADLNEAPSRLLGKFSKALERFRQELGHGMPRLGLDKKDLTALYRDWEQAQADIANAVHQEFQDLSAANKANADELAGVASIGSNGLTISQSILELRTQFHRLSSQIRGEHRIMYIWYDKYLTYVMFGIASTMAWWEEITSVPQRGGRFTHWLADQGASWIIPGFVLLVTVVGAVRAFNQVRLLIRRARVRGTTFPSAILNVSRAVFLGFDQMGSLLAMSLRGVWRLMFAPKLKAEVEMSEAAERMNTMQE